jgi:transposase InsO family protein
MTVRRQLAPTIFGPWNEPGQKTDRGTAFPANVHDQLALGTKLRILAIVDTHSRVYPAADPRFTCRGEDVVRTLEQVCAQVGYPRTIRVDNGSKFISRDLDLWAYARMSRWTSHVLASRRTTVSSRRSPESSAQSA